MPGGAAQLDRVRRLTGSGVLALGVWAGCVGDARVGFDLPRGLHSRAGAGGAGGHAGAADEPPAAGSGPGELPDGGAVDPLALLLTAAGMGPLGAAVALRCPSTCVTLAVAVSGGRGPYQVRWDDGSAAPQREVCPVLTTEYTVQVSDSASPAALAARRVRVEVEPCPPPPLLCVRNGSCEGTPNSGPGFYQPGGAFDAAFWDACVNQNPDGPLATPDVVNETSSTPGAVFPPASRDATYFHLLSDLPIHDNVSQALCEPLRAGTRYSFSVDLAALSGMSLNARPLGPAQLEVYVAEDACRRQDLVWTSPVLGPSWQSYCVSFEPARDAQHLVLNPTGSTPSSAVLVDNLVPVERCP